MEKIQAHQFFYLSRVIAVELARILVRDCFEIFRDSISLMFLFIFS